MSRLGKKLIIAICCLLNSCDHGPWLGRDMYSMRANKGSDAEGKISDDIVFEEEGIEFSLDLGLETLIWKRYRAFEQSIMHALSLAQDEVCHELGNVSCIDKIHLGILGGNDPFENGQYEQAKGPSILTPIAVERIIFSACQARVNLDRGLNKNAIIFKNWVYQDEVPEKAVFQAAETLYQRFLSRLISTEERDIVTHLLALQKDPQKVAIALCFLVGTHVENLFL